MIKIIEFRIEIDKRLEKDMKRLLSKISYSACSTTIYENKYINYRLTDVDPDDWCLLLHDMCDCMMAPTVYTFA